MSRSSIDVRRRLTLRGLLATTSLVFIVVTVFSMGATWFWIADLIANLRIQILIAGACLLLINALAREKWLLFPLCLGMAFHCSFCGEFFRSAQIGFAKGTAVRVASINVLTSNSKHRLIIEEIRRLDADVVAVLELSSTLAERLRMELVEKYPHQIIHPLDRSNFGIGLLSRSELTGPDVFELNETIVSISAYTKGFRVIATHPLPPMNQALFKSRNAHLRLLSERINATDDQTKTIVMGDFNLTPWSPHFHRFKRRSSLRRATKGNTITPTWYGIDDQFLFGLPLDHVLISSDLDCTGYEVGNDIGSDHRAVMVDVMVR
ncbi:endonuclease/exonuclease/phosphatase family protein [Roseiconus lacunae]|uniref:endonuclease/exonuclease/phosphatase family protein n=1 Tax=Roseiconus lacunae TaxID=2605694 RepID=UPI001E436EC6|nr:endonuclease/exonuclease/phosphatase family protein [Roseiconus lacunae]MCD0459035.1 endonuclease/exonuclease/phosphatase family protein [Roseiconus lacunae]